MPSDCVFELNKENAIYFSGETIAGTVTLKNTNDKIVREVCIIFLGEGKVHWSESETSTNNSNSSTHYRSHEIYINNSTTVYGDGTLQAGIHTFTFNITLPWECPTSIEAEYGNIRYEISLKINRYYRFDNIYKKPVTIIKTMDLNLNPIFKIPVILEDISRSCCWPCSRGTISCNLSIPFGAYAPGQPVKYTLRVENQSMDDTEGYKLEFKHKIIFSASTPHHKQRHTTKTLVSRNFSDKCLRLSNRVFEGEFFIPAIPPTTERSTIICVEYFLQIAVQLPCCISNPKCTIPLVIGTIPIRESLATNQFLNSEGYQQPCLPSAPVISAPVPNNNEIIPPNFEEAIESNSPFIDCDINERIRITGFRPLYPMYNTPYQAKH